MERVGFLTADSSQVALHGLSQISLSALWRSLERFQRASTSLIADASPAALSAAASGVSPCPCPCLLRAVFSVSSKWLAAVSSSCVTATRSALSKGILSGSRSSSEALDPGESAGSAAAAADSRLHTCAGPEPECLRSAQCGMAEEPARHASGRHWR